MGRIQNYDLDTNVSGQDKLIGSDTTGATKNFTLDSIGKYFSNNDVIKSNNQLSLKFVSSVSDIGYATFAKLGFGGDGSTMSNSTGFLVSKYNSKGESVEKLIRRVFANQITMSRFSNLDVFCVYDVTSIIDSVNYSGFFEIQVNALNGSGAFINQEHFIISVSSISGDKNYEHDQSSPSSTWVINHNLNKRPSVTVVDSASTEIICDVVYNSTNQVTLSFDAPTSGKAYIN